MKKKLESIRIEYNSQSINYNNLFPDPIDQLKLWMNEAIDFKIKDPNAVVLSTYDNVKGIQSRVVLIKDINEFGLIFYTNFDSVKGAQITNNKHVSLCFFWSALERQVRISGSIKKISDSDSDAYWDSRPVNSKISAIFSKQSQEIKKDFNFEKEFEAFNKKYKNEVIRRPNNWGGYIITPNYFEFWAGRKNRQHDRFVYEKKEEWLIRRLFP
tara:strand:+ start:1410 stop:2048 length:639 start_codon:yes stop_codon:yes gene_type:complete